MADAAADEILRDFPPRPVPTVREMDVPYECVNGLNGYRDALYARLRGRPEEVEAYRERASGNERNQGARAPRPASAGRPRPGSAYPTRCATVLTCGSTWRSGSTTRSA